MRKIDVYRQWHSMVAPSGETILQQAVRLRIAPSNIIDQLAWVTTFEKACEKSRYGARQVAIDCVSRSYGGGAADYAQIFDRAKAYLYSEY